jgi:hypothetical protein
MFRLNLAVVAALCVVLGACAGNSQVMHTDLPQHSFKATDLAGKTLAVEAGSKNPPYEVAFNADGTFTRTLHNSDGTVQTGQWKIVEYGNVYVYVYVKRGVTLSFFGPSANGSYLVSDPSAGGKLTPATIQ